MLKMEKSAGILATLLGLGSRSAKSTPVSDAAKAIMKRPTVADQSAPFVESTKPFLDVLSGRHAAKKFPSLDINIGNGTYYGHGWIHADGSPLSPRELLNLSGVYDKQFVHGLGLDLKDISRWLTVIPHEIKHWHQIKDPVRTYRETARMWKPIQQEMNNAGVVVRQAVPRADGKLYQELEDLPLEAHNAFYKLRGEPRWLAYRRMRGDTLMGLAELERYAGIQRPGGLVPTKAFLRSRRGRALGAMGQIAGHEWHITPATSDVRQLRSYLMNLYNDPQAMQNSSLNKLLLTAGTGSALGTGAALYEARG